jgi:hypothetical protein
MIWEYLNYSRADVAPGRGRRWNEIAPAGVAFSSPVVNAGGLRPYGQATGMSGHAGHERPAAGLQPGAGAGSLHPATVADTFFN